MFIPKLRSPIVLVHGLLGYDRIGLGRHTFVEYFRGVRQALSAGGNRVLVPRLSMTAGIDRRARELAHFINSESPSEPVHVLAHSMGGLDTRYMISRLGMSQRVLSLTSIGTPHRGSTFADWALRRLEAIVKPLLQVLRVPYRAFLDLTTAAGQVFDRSTPDLPNVRYFSVAGRCERSMLSPYWRFSHNIVERAEGPNDGVVSLASARHGESFDIWEGDHLNLINVPNVAARRRGIWTDRTPLYVGLVQRLADCGF